MSEPKEERPEAEKDRARAINVGWYSMKNGVESCFQKLYILKTFGKTIYLKFKTWIVEANIISL